MYAQLPGNTTAGAAGATLLIEDSYLVNQYYTADGLNYAWRRYLDYQEPFRNATAADMSAPSAVVIAYARGTAAPYPLQFDCRNSLQKQDGMPEFVRSRRIVFVNSASGGICSVNLSEPAISSAEIQQAAGFTPENSVASADGGRAYMTSEEFRLDQGETMTATVTITPSSWNQTFGLTAAVINAQSGEVVATLARMTTTQQGERTFAFATPSTATCRLVLLADAFDTSAIGVECQSLTAVKKTDGSNAGKRSKTPAVPAEYLFAGNYPNPFNPATTVSYALKEPSRVKLAVYDLLGRRVALLVDREQEARTHSVPWNAAGVASGTYLIRLEAVPISNPNKPFTAVHKAVVMK